MPNKLRRKWNTSERQCSWRARGCSTNRATKPQRHDLLLIPNRERLVTPLPCCYVHASFLFATSNHAQSSLPCCYVLPLQSYCYSSHIVEDSKAMALIVEPFTLVHAAIRVVADADSMPYALTPLAIVRLLVDCLHSCAQVGAGDGAARVRQAQATNTNTREKLSAAQHVGGAADAATVHVRGVRTSSILEVVLP